MLKNGTTKLLIMTSLVSKAQDLPLNTELKTSPSGSGELQPIWVVVLPKMPTNQPLLFANIPQKVMLDLMMLPIHLVHMLITLDQALKTTVS